jgi:UDPglucose 6-dehydrogenase
MKNNIPISLLIIGIIPSLYGSYNITIMGTGYVGLVSGTCFAQMGNNVICTDIDQEKIALLSDGKIPIYEPGLSDLIYQNVQMKRLHFSCNIAESIKNSDIIIITVNTPSQANGQADLTALESAISFIASHIDSYKLIVIKSTVPIGTNNHIKALLYQLKIPETLFDLVANPEFLREGNALSDFLYPDRIIIGSDKKKPINIMKKIYKNLPEKTPIIITDQTTAEAIKYASNTFLALKVSFMNELANLCDAIGAHVTTIADAMGLDKRISPQFLNPGPGFGGSCFPKDSLALAHTAKEYNVPMLTVQAILDVNNFQKKVPITKLKNLIDNDLSGKTIALLGLAFKADTDDVRSSPAITIIDALQQEGAVIQAYDPQAMPNMKMLYPQLAYYTNPYEALMGANAVIILTEWPEFITLDLARAEMLMADKILIDCRNILDQKNLIAHGFQYQTIGNGGFQSIAISNYLP